MIFPQASATIGATPLVSLQRICGDEGGEVCAKLEYFNPGGSVKDRIGVAMIGAAEAKGLLVHNQSTLVEPTSGNTGIALAMVCAARGYRLTLTMPEGMSRERTKLLRAYGAEVRETSSMGGMDESVELARQIAADTGAFMPHQFSNPANPQAHFRTTGPEIWTDTKGDVAGFVCGVGTGGTITGVARYLKEQGSDAKIIAVEPASSPVLSGGSTGPHRIQGIGAGFVPEILDLGLVDEIVTVSDDQALEMTQELARHEGVLAGISAGANVHAARELARRDEFRDGRVVTLVCDSGDRYMSLPFYGT